MAAAALWACGAVGACDACAQAVFHCDVPPVGLAGLAGVHSSSLWWLTAEGWEVGQI